jgi:hypothetical protein
MDRTCLTLAVALLLMPASQDPWRELAARVEVGSPPIAVTLTESVCRHLAGRGLLSQARALAAPDKAALIALIRDAAGKDLLDVGQEMIDSFESNAPRLAPSGWVARSSDHYVFLARTGSPAESDLAVVADEVELAHTALVRAFGLQARLDGKFAALDARLPDGVSGVDSARRVPIYLFSARDSEAGRVISSRSQGSASIGATLDGSSRGRLTAAVRVLYFGPLSLAVVQHEVGHVVASLAAFDAGAIDRVLTADTLKAAFMAGYRKMPAFFTEGVGDYGLLYTGFYARWGLFGRPEHLALQIQRSTPLPAMRALASSDQSFYAQRHKAASLAAATFLRFLLLRHGADRVRDWLLAGADAGRPFSQAFGAELAQAESQWHAWLREQAGASTTR